MMRHNAEALAARCWRRLAADGRTGEVMRTVDNAATRRATPTMGRVSLTSVPAVGSRLAPPRRGLLGTVLAVVLSAVGLTAVAAALSSGLGLVEAAQWAAAQQRAFYDLFQRLLSLEGGVLASAGLVGACAAYGFMHAAVPGHGKFLIAGAGIATRASVGQLVALSLAASASQALTAIVLVYGSFALFDITAGWARVATDRVLVPLSYVAILAIAAILVHRGVVGLRRAWQRRALSSGPCGHHVEADEDCGCGHRHGPTAADVERLTSWRDAAVLVAGIGLRPCTGAVIVLVAAWRFDLLAVGALGAFAMALGTGAFLSLVAMCAATARGATLFAAGARGVGIAAPALQLVAGASIGLVATLFLVGSVLPSSMA